MILKPLVIGYYANGLCGTTEDVHPGIETWTFAIGGDYKADSTYRLLIQWLRDNDFNSDDYSAIPHRHNYGPPKAWLDFFNKSEAMRFRMICGGTFRQPLTFDNDIIG